MDVLTQRGATAALGNFTLTGITGAATTHSSAAMAYSIRGICYSHATDSGVATPTVDFVTNAAITLTANKARVVVFGLDSGDAPRIVAGPIVDLDSAGNFLQTPQFPDIPDTLCPCAYVVMKGGSTLSGTFTVGSSNWNTAGMTFSVKNVAPYLPDRPQTA